MKLPEEYVRYCAGDAPKEGGLTVQPLWFQLWAPSDVEQLNRDYHVQEFAPGFLGFGSNGGGELLVFDAAGRVVTIPFDDLCRDGAWLVADSWADFEKRIER